MAKAWGLKGKMGMASLGKGRVLLELEFAEEARRVLLSGNKAVGGVQLDLEHGIQDRVVWKKVRQERKCG